MMNMQAANERAPMRYEQTNQQKSIAWRNDQPNETIKE